MIYLFFFPSSFRDTFLLFIFVLLLLNCFEHRLFSTVFPFIYDTLDWFFSGKILFYYLWTKLWRKVYSFILVSIEKYYKSNLFRQETFFLNKIKIDNPLSILIKYALKSSQNIMKKHVRVKDKQIPDPFNPSLQSFYTCIRVERHLLTYETHHFNLHTKFISFLHEENALETQKLTIHNKNLISFCLLFDDKVCKNDEKHVRDKQVMGVSCKRVLGTGSSVLYTTLSNK